MRIFGYITTIVFLLLTVSADRSLSDVRGTGVPNIIPALWVPQLVDAAERFRQTDAPLDCYVVFFSVDNEEEGAILTVAFLVDLDDDVNDENARSKLPDCESANPGIAYKYNYPSGEFVRQVFQRSGRKNIYLK